MPETHYRRPPWPQTGKCWGTREIPGLSQCVASKFLASIFSLKLTSYLSLVFSYIWMIFLSCFLSWHFLLIFFVTSSITKFRGIALQLLTLTFSTQLFFSVVLQRIYHYVTWHLECCLIAWMPELLLRGAPIGLVRRRGTWVSACSSGIAWKGNWEQWKGMKFR